MYRIASLFGVIAVLGLFPLLSRQGRESGWISTCDGVGCGGRGSPCYEYTWDGGQHWRYCYFR